MLEKVKLALRIGTSAFDAELNDLIDAALLDLRLAGVDVTGEPDALLARAVVTYCKVHFGDAAGDEFDRLKKAYDEQKAQLTMAEGYRRTQ